MRNAVVAGLLLALFSTRAATVVHAQVRTESPAQEAARLVLRADFREKVVHQDTVSVMPTRPAANGRVDVASGAYRARYRIRERLPSGLGTEAAALAYLEREAQAYGIDGEVDRLRVESVREGSRARHVRLRQTLEGVPVYGRDVTVSLDQDAQPTMVVSGYASHLDDVTSFDPAPRISQTQARRIVQSAVQRGLDTTEPELVVYPSKPPRLAWRVVASIRTLPVSWEVLVDARTGEVIRMLDVSLHAHARSEDASAGEAPLERRTAGLGAPTPAQAYEASGSAAPPARAYEASGFAAPPARAHEASGFAAPPARAHKASGFAALVDGTGYVFDPDPLTSAGVTYGGEYVDGDDQDTPALTEQLFTVTLRDITQGADGRYRLEGPYVRIEGDASAVPVESSPDAFTYTRADDRFEAVNAYYHVDKSQRYVQSLDVGFPIKDEPVRVNPQGLTRDDSNYDSGQDLIRLGVGGIDDAEDADVVWHEYGHVLLNFTTPGLTVHFEGKALHEGWADYWAASYSRFLSEDDPQIPQHDWRRLYTWDGNLPCWPGRTLDHDGHYDDDLSYDAPGCQVIAEQYQWGLLWATTLMNIYPQVGRAVLDRLNLASHAYLASSSTFRDAAEALIQADIDLYDGAHNGVLVQELSEAGYVDPAQYGPVLSHEPLKSTEGVGGTVEVEVTASPTTAPVDSVIVFYAVDDGPFGTLVLVRQEGNRYAGELALPGEQTTIRYYVEAVDAQRRRRRLPAAAPEETYVFEVGPDLVAPTIRHDPRTRAAVIAWPIDIFAEVADNVGVDSVWVEYEMRGSAGSVYADGSFELHAGIDAYSGRFPEPATPPREGDVVSYRVLARDAASAGNEAALPEEGTFSIDIVEDGVLRVFDFEGINEGLTPTGSWAVGAPSYGLRVAHSGERAWATNPGGAYSAAAGTSALQLPPVDLAEIGPAYLVFWHWYDFEHNGLAEPGEFKEAASLWDAGNLKVWTDEWGEWRIVEPQSGYNGWVGANFGNPLAGQPAFGGYSYGWRREVVELPDADGVRIRFDLGTDHSNDQDALYFAGWYVDDVTITTRLPVDSERPSAAVLPAPRIVRVQGQETPPNVSIEVSDDTGLEAVFSEYVLSSGGPGLSGRLRLAMSGTDASIYEGLVVPEQSFVPGDRIEYTLLLRDFDGNETRYGDPFVVDFRTEERTTAIEDAVATGAWRRLGSRWTAAASGSGTVSSLILEPLTLPSNSEASTLLLEHVFALGSGLGGNVKVSVDDGSSWTVLMPDSGYGPAFAPGGSHPMAGEPVFTGTSEGSTEHAFDLTPYAGRSVRLRVDLGHARPLEAEDDWSIQGMSIRSLSVDEDFQNERELALHANFPDPFAERTTVSYTVPGTEIIPVRLSVFDLLGRRVAVLRHAQHEPGTYTVQFDAGTLSNGVYVLYLESPRGTRSERMVVAR